MNERDLVTGLAFVREYVSSVAKYWMTSMGDAKFFA